MNLTVIGTGYVGLVTGACVADLGSHQIDLLNRDYGAGTQHVLASPGNTVRCMTALNRTRVQFCMGAFSNGHPYCDHAPIAPHASMSRATANWSAAPSCVN